VADPRVEQFIRDHVAIMQEAQRALWDAHESWRLGRFLSGVAFPAALVLRIGAYDWSEAVNAWQHSVDTWWTQGMTDAVRAAPDEPGEDGVKRIDAWAKMGASLMAWAQRIAADMGDDTLANDLRFFGENLKRVVRAAIDAGLNLALGSIPPWIFIAAAGVAGLVLFTRRR
jgi:hypothetical protein